MPIRFRKRSEERADTAVRVSNFSDLDKIFTQFCKPTQFHKTIFVILGYQNSGKEFDFMPINHYLCRDNLELI